MWEFSFIGIRIQIHFSFLLLIAVFFFMGNGYLALYSAIFSMMHEFSHGIAARKLGYTPESITAGLSGGVLHLREGYLRSSDELLIHLSGPFFNLSMSMLFYIVYLYFPVIWIRDIIVSNLILALFNLMPFYPLDGGKITGLYLSYFFGYRNAYIISKTFSYLFSVFLFFLGIYLLQYSVINLLISALAVNLYFAVREDSRYSFYRLMCIYTDLEKENSKWN